ncbi:hypothetical protein FRC03_008626 [Tulasnella sp. 419]|nr:hypothetical protein FRC03_008626 [Tulasnella sp. 419]
MAGNLLIGAAHTTVGLLHWVVLLASIHQDKQEKIREELDRVVGPDRIPDDKDLPKLPYLRAFIREVLRFRPVLPLAIPHAAGEDQLYRGYLIPKGCTIILNLWAILHDPNLFEDPDVFNPDRYINIEAGKADLYKKLESLPFGTGRRICPGMSLANRMVELTVASLIWGFHFSPRREGDLHENNFIMVRRSSRFSCDVRILNLLVLPVCNVQPQTIPM